jgi:hypothetical protein
LLAGLDLHTGRVTEIVSDHHASADFIALLGKPVWADIDNDGFLDLFVGNENEPGQLFRNKGDGTFEDISHSAGIDRTSFAKGVVAADYDNDGYVDFYVSNMNGGNYLCHNNRNGTFTEIAKQAGVQGTGRSFAAWFFDYDNDGWPDLFVTSYYTSIEETLQTHLGLAHKVGALKLYKDLGNGAFRDVSKETAWTASSCPWGPISATWITMDIRTSISAREILRMLPSSPTCCFGIRKESPLWTSPLPPVRASYTTGTASPLPTWTTIAIGGATPGDSHAFRLSPFRERLDSFLDGAETPNPA